MRSKAGVILLALGVLGLEVPGAMAQGTPASPTDSTKANAGSTAPAPVTPAPAAPAPVTPAPAPAAKAPVTPAPAPAAASTAGPSRVYYGGQVTLSFGSTTRIGIFPLVGYKLTPKLSGGAKAGYEYVDYDNGPSANNYGGSVFARFRVGRSLYAHAEYEAINYELPTGPESSSREWVPFVLLGGGFTRAISPRTSVYAEVLFDVLQDDKSPYKDWEPIVNFGVGVGF